MSQPDHMLLVQGIWEGEVMLDLECLHENDEDKYLVDNKGKWYDRCLIQEWFDADRRDVLGVIDKQNMNTSGDFRCYTIWNLDFEPKLVGNEHFKEWTESQ